MENTKKYLKTILVQVKDNKHRFEHLIAKATHFQNVLELTENQIVDCLNEEEVLKKRLKSVKRSIFSQTKTH